MMDTYKRTSILLTFSMLLASCGKPNFEAPELKTESPYLCSTVNDFVLINEMTQAQKIADMSINSMNREYVGESYIEKFQDKYLKNIEYRFGYYKVFFNACEANASKGINEVAPMSLTKLYHEISKNGSMATCQSFNDNLLSYKEIMRSLSNPSREPYMEYISSIKKVQNDADFGDLYIEENLKNECEDNPVARIQDVVAQITRPIAKSIREKEAEVVRKQEHEEQLRQAKIEEAKYRENVELYSEGLFKTGEASCSRFIKQYDISVVAKAKSKSDFDSVTAGIKETLHKVADELPPAQKPLFNNIISTQPLSLAEQVFNKCRYSHYDLKGSLLKVNLLNRQADSVELELDKFYKERMDAASLKAMDQYKLCKSYNFKNALCFKDANSYYSYFVLQHEIKALEKSKTSIVRKINIGVSKNEVFDEVENCRKLAFREKRLSAEELNKYEREVCVSKAKQERLDSYNEKLKLLKADLNNALSHMESIEEQAISKPQSVSYH
ncbi:hypothetical protein GBO14_19075 [Pseudoalteromonas shioyasakiensis]|uniref:hypothetical protein n=1 Tax=Pseudoalteromonas shioyasakiensis TaxID=1190813 RepID=UPI00209517C9|nr:hypothetical protein [Pseudoalteromonas shioyasakiensis]MCO6356818.1 hypothetical protein [Pseudoalteromonas shioyasakiensis]